MTDFYEEFYGPNAVQQ